MKLIKLEILNLASLDKAGGEVINFEEGALGDSSIFSIVGPTGSGKSTILDAICLALYNRAPRYPRVKGGRKTIKIYGEPDELEKNRLSPTDCRNILTKGKKEGYSKLTFLANNQCVYRAEWHVKFNVKKFDDVITRLYRFSKDGKKVEEVEWTQLPNIIGLDYDQFLRTVLIAQGSFADFLTADEEDRYQLLEKLIGCEEMYSRIADEIKTRKDAAVSSFTKENASAEADKQFILDDVQLSTLKAEILQLETAEKQLTESQQKVQQELQWYTDNETKGKAVQTQEQQLATANEELEKYKNHFDQLDLYDALGPAIKLYNEISGLDNEVTGLTKSIGENKVKIEQIKEEKQQKSDELTILNNESQEIKRLSEEAAPHIKNARELLTKMETCQKSLEEKEKRKSDAEKEKEAAKKALNDNSSQIKEAEEAVRIASEKATEIKETVAQTKGKLQQAAKDANEKLTEKKNEIEGIKAEDLQNNKSLTEQALNDLNNALSVIKLLNDSTEEHTNKNNRHKELMQRNGQIDKDLSAINIEKLDNEVKTLRKTYTLMTSEQWTQHRSLLETGAPCPLCGSTEHPYKQDATQYVEAESELKKLLENKESEFNELSQKKTKLSEEKSSNEREMEIIQTRLEELVSIIENSETQWNTIQTAHPDFPKSMDGLNALKPDFEKRKTDAENALNTFNTVQSDISTLTEQKSEADKNQLEYEKTSAEETRKADAELSKAQAQQAGFNALTPNLLLQQNEKEKAYNTAVTEHKKAEDDLNDLKKLYEAELHGEHPDVVEKRLKTAKEENDAKVNTKTEEFNKLEKESSKISGIVNNLQELVTTKSGTRDNKKNELETWINTYNETPDRLRDIDNALVEKAATVDFQWEAIRRKKQECNEKVAAATALLESARTSYNDHQKTKPQSTAEELRNKEEELKNSSQQDQLLAAKTRKQNHDNAQLRLGSKAEKLSQLGKAQKYWTEITDAIGSDGKTLRKIAQCYTLRFLIEHSNAEIRKFNSRYELVQVKNSLGIRVIDHDRADDVRDTTSLSGGETFIVSLGLALGLSSLSSRNISFENLFIDEGFGTLDPDTLATVIDSLAMLQSKQGKKVGVISHTDTMSERITTQIRIVKNGNSGSSHIEIYP
ncbi:MAG: AAA family ATPase [Bacteroidales bacterium]|nr:AAA family ATPase [Bacteroidales bacterium]